MLELRYSIELMNFDLLEILALKRVMSVPLMLLLADKWHANLDFVVVAMLLYIPCYKSNYIPISI